MTTAPILAVDDSPDDLMSIGVVVEAAYDVRKAELLPDLILFNLMMNGRIPLPSTMKTEDASC